MKNVTLTAGGGFYLFVSFLKSANEDFIVSDPFINGCAGVYLCLF